MRTVTQESKQKPIQGRPRDPDLEDKVFHTAMTLYSSGGWQSLTFDRISKDASVGKAAIYRRWENRGELLIDALDAKWFAVSNIDTGSLKGDLQALAQMLFDKLTGEYGNTNFFLQADARKFPEVRRATVQYRVRLVREAMTIVHRGVSRDQKWSTIRDAGHGGRVHRPARVNRVLIVEKMNVTDDTDDGS